MKINAYPEQLRLYLDSLASRGKSVNTIRLYTSVLQRFGEYLSTLAGNPDITPHIIAGYRCGLREACVGANSIRQHMTILHAFFAKLEAFSRLTGGDERNPVLRDEFPEEAPVDYTDVLTPDEIQTLLNVQPKKTGAGIPIRNHAIVTLFLQSGLRNAELRALTVEDLDFDNHVITVRHGKGDKDRAAPFPAKAREAVRAYLAVRPDGLTDSDLLFGSTDGGGWHEYNGNALNALVKRYTRSIIGREIHCHLLRHAAASSWDDAGVPLRDVQKALGHADMRTTERIYVQVLHKSKAAQNISRAFDGV